MIATFTQNDVALVAATAKTILQLLAATNQRVKILSWSIFFKDTVATDTPVEIQLLRQTAVIGGTPTAITPLKNDSGMAETVQTTASVYGSAPTEPAGTTILKLLKVHPQSGYEIIYPYGQELILIGAQRIGFTVTGVQTQTCDICCTIEE